MATKSKKQTKTNAGTQATRPIDAVPKVSTRHTLRIEKAENGGYSVKHETANNNGYAEKLHIATDKNHLHKIISKII